LPEEAISLIHAQFWRLLPRLAPRNDFKSSFDTASKMKVNNPFIVLGYESPEYFCDRQAETDTLFSAIENQRHVTLISL